jgi:RNA polymerase sigma factor (sigma-70 family)
MSLPSSAPARLSFSSHQQQLAVPLPTTTVPTASADQARWLAEEIQPHEPALRGYLRSRFPSIETDDVVQESYLKILKTHTSDRVASAKGFLFTVARNTALNIFRRRQFYANTPVNELPSWRVLDGGRDAAESANAQFQLDLAIEAIGTLPNRCREVVTLIVVDRLGYAEIASRLGLSEATVRVQTAKGIEKIADYIRKKGERT